MRRSVWVVLLLLGCPSRAPVQLQGPPPDPDPFATHVRPFAKRYCFECHDARNKEGGVQLDHLTSLAAAQRQPALWRKVRHQLRKRLMPPSDAPQPTSAEIGRITSLINTFLAPVRQGDPGRPTLRRLNRIEYENTVRDLLGVDLRLAADLPDDDVGYGFDTIGSVLSLPPSLLEKYLVAAERVAAASIQVYRPLDRRFQAEKAKRKGRGGISRGFAGLWVNGDLSFRVTFPHDGVYTIKVRAFGDQAGPDPARFVARLDKKQVKRVNVRSRRRKPSVHTFTVKAKAGVRQVVISFVNDYYRPNAKPGQRDRNLHVDWIEVKGPQRPPALPPAHARLLGDARQVGETPTSWAMRVLKPIASRAFRRPVEAQELKRLVKLATDAVAAGDRFEEGLRVALTAILVSPHFLFRVELDPRPHDPQAVHPVSEFELAARLSYFLWSSLPDERLFALAQANKLRASLTAEVTRMLDDPKASALASQFAGQWLQLRRLRDAAPDPAAFPTFDEPLRDAMQAETELLFEAVLRENRSVLDFIDAPFTFVNERLAKHYGVPGVRGPRFRRVKAPQGRGGVLTHASVLTITSHPTQTSIVRRGKWVLEALLDQLPPPPPPGADSFSDAIKKQTGLSFRKKLELHRQRADCASCHTRMDAIGFGLQRFNGIGAPRTGEVDDVGRLPGGKTFRGTAGLRTYLRGQAPTFVRTLAKKLLIYGLGRGPQEADEAALDALVAEAAPRYRLKDLIHRLVRLDAFQKRRGEQRPKQPRRTKKVRRFK